MPPYDEPGLETAWLGGGEPNTRAGGSKPRFEPGTRVGDYEIVNAIGAGGMGEVYRVRNVISDRIEAMKVLLPSLSQQPELAERFTREIKVQAAMHHPNIASLHTAFHFNNQLVMLMEYVEGVPLDARLRQGAIPLPDCLAYVAQVLRALSYAHRQGVIHRDIKPSNIMLMPDGTVKLMDFGIANVAKDPKLTGTGVTVGSPYYMSPEQIRGEAPDPRSDIYSLGITLYELVTGRRPISGDSGFPIMSAHLNDAPTPPIALDHTLPTELNDIILMSIAKQPERRFQTADAFLNALESVRATLGGSTPLTATATPLPVGPPPVSAPRVVPNPAPPPPAPVASDPKSHRGLYMALGAIAAIVVLALAGLEAPKWFRTSARDPVPVVTPNANAPQTDPQSTSVPAPSEPAPAVVAAPPQSAKPAGVVVPPRNIVPLPAGIAASAPARQAIPIQRDNTRDAPPAPQLPPVAPQQQAPPSLSAVSGADFQNTVDRMAQLSSRMSSIDRSLQRLEQSQNASGLGIRSDFIQARDMMHSFLGQAEEALRNRDSAAATRYLDRAEIQVDKLAKALNQ